MSANNCFARWANTALSAMLNEAGDSGDEESNMCDLIRFFYHFADAHGLDFEAVRKRAYATYTHDLEYEGGPADASAFE